jgi:hypothetical protein
LKDKTDSNCRTAPASSTRGDVKASSSSISKSLRDHSIFGLSSVYACRKQRAMIKTYNVIIATTLDTIRYSMCLPDLFG